MKMLVRSLCFMVILFYTRTHSACKISQRESTEIFSLFIKQATDTLHNAHVFCYLLFIVISLITMFLTCDIKCMG